MHKAKSEAISISLYSLPLTHFSPMTVNACQEGQDAYNISLIPDDVTTNEQCGSQLAFLGHSEVPTPTNTEVCSNVELNYKNYINLGMENAGAYSPFVMEMDIEKGSPGTLTTNDEAVEKLKIEGPITHLERALQKQIGLQIGEKCMHLLMNDSLALPKFISRDKSATERVHETPNNRTRKYKRSASFNSRKIVLLFSILSSMGTMILIYLTLRVKQIGA
ncbi:uncharacterized protein LOC127803166 [Diospyros lotus]|uniref:uncharacterized protein LOC127803166 n=1 Tax=Diospyros lotus TaxID=55363 RepID=UPI00225896D6|nr:uncharacterized protein LOC127803166 [Diospyros lotus]